MTSPGCGEQKTTANAHAFVIAQRGHWGQTIPARPTNPIAKVPRAELITAASVAVQAIGLEYGKW